MIRSLLFSRIGKSKVVQMLIGYIPIILCLIYLVFYILDISSVYAVIADNNKLVGTDYSATHHKVINVTQDEGIYNLEFESTITREVITKKEELFFTVNCADADWVIYDFGSKGEDLSIHNSVITGVGKIVEEDLYEYNLFGETIKYYRYGKICDIYVNKEGTYTLKLFGSNGRLVKELILDELYGVSTVETRDDLVKMSVSNECVLKTSSLDIKYVDCFSDDNIYYDIYQKVLVRNISDDFATNILIGNKFFIVLASSLIFTVMFWFARRIEEFNELREKCYFIMSLIVTIFSVLVLLLTYILFV